MRLYKIGLHNDNDKPTLLNNSALYEYNRLKAILNTIDCDDFMCILNGVGEYRNYPGFESRKKIFIATDGFCFHKNKDVIDMCDYVIHQSEKKLDFIHKPQTYNYVPFVFTNDQPKSIIQDDKIVFGGASRGRDDKIRKYILNGRGFNPDVVAFLKMYDAHDDVIFDNRVEYEEFIKILRTYKYTICFSRKEYDEMRWTTARYIESISNYVLPFIDSTYCVHHSFYGLEDIVTSYKDMRNKISNLCENERQDKIHKLMQVVNAHKNAFRDTIMHIIS